MVNNPSEYQKIHDSLMQETPPDPNNFMQWLFTSGILTPHQLDLIRAKMHNPMLSGLNAEPGSQAGTGAAMAAAGATKPAGAAALPGGPQGAPAAKPVSAPPVGGMPNQHQPKGTEGARPLKTGAATGQM